MTRYDLSLALRSFAFTVVTLLIAAAIVVLTDEPFSTASMRVARLCAFAPGLSAIGAGVATTRAAGQGELRALSALGASPWSAARGAALSAAVVGAAAVLLLLSPYADPSALFPAVTRAAWQRIGAGLIESQSGVYVAHTGELSFATLKLAALSGFQPSGGAAALAVAPLALTIPLWITTPMPLRWRLLAALVGVLLTILLFHAAAAMEVPIAMLALTAAPFALQVVLFRVRESYA